MRRITRWPACVALAAVLGACATKWPRSLHDLRPDPAPPRTECAVVATTEVEMGSEWRTLQEDGSMREGSEHATFRIEAIDGRAVSPPACLLAPGRHALRVREDRDGVVTRYILDVDMSPGRVYGLRARSPWAEAAPDSTGAAPADEAPSLLPDFHIARADCADMTDTLDPATLRRIRTAKLHRSAVP